MGVIKEAERKEERGPECPPLFIGTFEKYRELKFIRRTTSDTMRLYPRDMLTWQEVTAFTAATGQKISMFEAELIMGLDAIFEGRDDG